MIYFQIILSVAKLANARFFTNQNYCFEVTARKFSCTYVADYLIFLSSKLFYLTLSVAVCVFFFSLSLALYLIPPPYSYIIYISLDKHVTGKILYLNAIYCANNSNLLNLFLFIFLHIPSK